MLRRDLKEISDSADLRPLPYWPSVVFLGPPLVRVGLVGAFVAQHVRRNVVDLDAGRVVQHLQVLKHRLTDLLQVLHRPVTKTMDFSSCHLLPVCSQQTAGNASARWHAAWLKWTSADLSGVLVFYPGADVRVQREVWGEVLEIFCRGPKHEQVNKEDSRSAV